MTETNNKFFLYLDEEEGADLQVEKLQDALWKSVQSDVGLSLEVVFVDGEEIRALNKDHRGVDSVTDVLSFPSFEGIKGQPLKKENFPYGLDEEGNLFLGSIVICRQRAKEQAEEYGHSYARELHYLLVHGAMHCLGYDHMTEEEKAEMRQKEEEVLSMIGMQRV